MNLLSETLILNSVLYHDGSANSMERTKEISTNILRLIEEVYNFHPCH